MSKETAKIHKDWIKRIDKMDDATAGQFAKSIFALANGFDPPDHPELRFLLGEVRSFYQEQETKKQAISEIRRLAWKNGGLAKASKCYKNLANASNCQEKLANASESYQMLANATNSDKDWDFEILEEAEGIYNNINNNKLYTLVELFTKVKITNYKQIYTISKKKWEKNYFYTQYLEAEKIVKKIWIETFETVLKFCLVDDFWKNQILSVAKLNKKNKEWAYYYDVMIDKIRERKPPAQTIYSADLV